MKHWCRTGKYRYRDEIAAKIALASTTSLSQPGSRSEKRIYQCPFCNGYHLTSQAQRKKRA